MCQLNFDDYNAHDEYQNKIEVMCVLFCVPFHPHSVVFAVSAVRRMNEEWRDRMHLYYSLILDQGSR